LVNQWQRLQAETENAAKELGDARTQFAGLLQTLQSNEDFIDELVEIRQAEKAIEVIKSLTRNIRDASAQLNRLIGSIKPPGAYFRDAHKDARRRTAGGRHGGRGYCRRFLA